MLKFNITKEQVGNVITNGLKLAFGVLVLSLPYLNRDDTNTICKDYKDGETSYSDAVEAIMNSSMFDSNKTLAMKLLKRYEDAEYYKAIILVVESDMFDSTKLRNIEMLSM